MNGYTEPELTKAELNNKSYALILQYQDFSEVYYLYAYDKIMDAVKDIRENKMKILKETGAILIKCIAKYKGYRSALHDVQDYDLQGRKLNE